MYCRMLDLSVIYGWYRSVLHTHSICFRRDSIRATRCCFFFRLRPILKCHNHNVPRYGESIWIGRIPLQTEPFLTGEFLAFSLNYAGFLQNHHFADYEKIFCGSGKCAVLNIYASPVKHAPSRSILLVDIRLGQRPWA